MHDYQDLQNWNFYVCVSTNYKIIGITKWKKNYATFKGDEGGNITNINIYFKLIKTVVETFKTSKYCEINFSNDHSGSAMANTLSYLSREKKKMYSKLNI
jgi:hypothetical protein